MADRSVTVRLRADISQFRRAMRESSADTNKLGRDVDAAGRRLDHFGASSRSAGNDLDSMSSRARKAGSEIDTLSGRLGLLGKAALAVGPSLVPIGALGVPAIAALANATAAAGAALGTTLLAFNGVGDALDKLNKAQLEPTREHINDARDAFKQISPEARQFVIELDNAGPALQKLKRAAGTEMFPGLTKGLDSALTQLPQAQGLLKAIGGSVGDLGEMTGKSLASGKWSEFLTFLRTDLPPTISQLGQSIGSVTHGLAELWMAFGPLNNDITGGLVKASEDFDRWASTLDQTEGFENFIAFIRESGPQVGETLGAIGNAFLQIGEAAAPLGGPVLDVLEKFADVVASIADSPIGTPLLGIASAVSALSLLNKAMASTKAMMTGSMLGGGTPVAGGGIGAYFQRNASLVKVSAAQIKMSLGEVAAVMATTGARTERESRRMATSLGTAAAASGKLLKGAGALAAPLAGLALSATDVDEKIGLSNTAMFALYGTMAGPWGAAAGATIGLLTDMTSASGKMGEAQKKLDKVFSSSSSSVGDYVNSLAEAIAARDAMAKDEGSFTSITDFFSDVVNVDANILTGKGLSQVDDLGKSIDIADPKVRQLAASLYQLYDETGGTGATGPLWGDPSKSSVFINLKNMQMIADQAGPAMAALGYTIEDLANPGSQQNLDLMIRSMSSWQQTADSAEGKTQTLKSAFNNLDNELASTANKADLVKSALDALLDPQLNLSQATDTWNDGLRHLKDGLDESSRSLKGNSDGASKNREEIRNQVENLKGLVNAQAQTGASGRKLANTMRDGRDAIMKAGEAANLSKDEMRAYLKTLGLTPRTIKTLIDADTRKAQDDVTHLQQLMNNLKSKTVFITTVNRTVGAGGQRGGKAIPLSADGSTVPKDSGGYFDKHLYMLAPGEEIISNRHGQADRHRPLLKAINRGLADGGTTGKDNPLFTTEGPGHYRAAYRHNKKFAVPGPYQTTLTPEDEAAFMAWVASYGVPFDPGARIVDYDMRGYWKKTKGRGWSPGSHFPDTYKTPYDTTFSHESKYATGNNPFYWHGNRLVDERNGQVVFAANGGSVAGGGAYRDRIPYLLAPGEEIISNRHGQADRHRPLLKAINRGLADGGTAGDDGDSPKTSTKKKPRHKFTLIDTTAWAEFNRQGESSTRTLRELKKELARQQRALDASTKAVENETAVRDDLASKFGTLASTVADMFRTQLFGPLSDALDVWTSTTMDGVNGVADPIKTLQSDIANATEYQTLFNQLKSGGQLSPEALSAAALGGTAGLRTVAAYSPDQQAQYSSLLATRDKLASDTGTAVAQAQYGQALDDANASLAYMIGQNDRLQQLVKGLNRGVEETTEATKAGAAAIHSSANKARRDKKGRR